MKRYTITTGVILLAILALCMASCGGQSQTAAKVDVNTATAQELQKVPGVDQTLAQNIVDFRDANGPFSSVDDLARVKGMNEQKLSSIRDYVTVEGTSGTQQGPAQEGQTPSSGSGSQPMSEPGSGGPSSTGS